MNSNIKLTKYSQRTEILAYIDSLKKQTPNFTLIDVGASACPWIKDHVTHTVDCEPSGLSVKQFIGNISLRPVWDEILAYVAEHGKFSFCSSTHTIEDISAAPMVLSLFDQIAEQGYLAIPSKYSELTHHDGNWLGHIHHR